VEEVLHENLAFRSMTLERAGQQIGDGGDLHAIVLYRIVLAGLLSQLS